MTFTQFSKTEFEQFLRENYPKFVLSPATKTVREYVYDIPLREGVVIRVWSSIDKSTQLSRSYGTDSINIVLVDTIQKINLSGRNKTNREGKWKKHLKEKVDMLLQIEKINFKESCPICGSHTVIRTAHKGKFKGQAFVGCSNFPKCTYTTFLPKSIEVSSSSPPTNKMSSLPTPTVSIQPISSSNNPKNPTDPDRFTLKDAQTLGDILKIDFSKVALSEYHMGLNVELEHEGTIKTNRQLSEIVLAHLDEHEDYYTRLHVMENAPASPSLPFVIEASDGLSHENCGGQIDLQTPHKNQDNDTTHWDAQCLKCHQKGTVLND